MEKLFWMELSKSCKRDQKATMERRCVCKDFEPNMISYHTSHFEVYVGRSAYGSGVTLIAGIEADELNTCLLWRRSGKSCGLVPGHVGTKTSFHAPAPRRSSIRTSIEHDGEFCSEIGPLRLEATDNLLSETTSKGGKKRGHCRDH
jgi:hypothetical protein